MQKEIILKNALGHIIVIAPPSSGKSVLLGKIKKMLKEEFGEEIKIVEDRPLQEPLTEKHKDWENEMVKNTVWILKE